MWKEAHKQTDDKPIQESTIPTLDEPKDEFMKRCRLEKLTEPVLFPNIINLQTEITTLLDQNTQLNQLKDKQIEKDCEEEWKNRPIRDPLKPPGDPGQQGRGGQQGSADDKKERILYCFDCEQITPLINTNMELNNNTDTLTIKPEMTKDDFKATCVIGDRFYKGKFLPMIELQKSHKTLEGSYHDINHWGTTYLDGNPNIEYIVGYNDNVKLDQQSKAMTADIHVLKSAEKYQLWRGFVDINQKINRIPNVSVSFYASKKNVKASSLPVDFAAHGYHKDDEVEYLYDLEFQALSTVFKGACNDKDGCGIHKQDAIEPCKNNCHTPKPNDDMKIIDEKKILEDKIRRLK